MLGQGRPHVNSVLALCWMSHRKCDFEQPLRWLMVCCALSVTALAHAQPTDLQLRVAFGGGAARTWRGSLKVQNGSLADLRYLGLDADESATIYLDGDAVLIRQLAERDYDGFDVRLQAAAGTALKFELAPEKHPEETRHIEIPLADLITGYYHTELDSQGNQLLIQRVSGDALRVIFDRTSLVFTPGETFDFQIQPHQLGVEAGAALRYHVQLVAARTDKALWEQDLESTLGEGGSSDPVGPVSVVIPPAEGVYDIVVSAYRKKTLRSTFVRPKPLYQRRVQLVAIASAAAAEPAQAWELVDTIDPKSARWMEWLTRLPKLPLLPDIRQEPLRNGKSSTLRHQQQDLVQLAPGGWQAYPLPVQEVGKPHLLEVEYPNDLPQTLAISIVEPNAVGKVVPLGLDSGVYVTPPVAADLPSMLRHKLIFWPRTATPLVLLTNRQDEAPAVFGRIRVYAGPVTLPAVTSGTGAVPPARLLAAYFDKPLFPENFCASEVADDGTVRSLRDWVTFYEGGRRLVEYLKHVGYNGAVICVARQGSAIYPSVTFNPTPKYDTGTLFSTGQDPVRKDVLEMLFRLFDREGLTLVPAVQFSFTLDDLERQMRGGGSEADGIALAEGQGRTWRELRGADHGMGPHYNPLDPRVQATMRQVLNELTDRYARHTAFGGLALQLDPETYAILPGEPWGQDQVTRRRFEQTLAQGDTALRAEGRGLIRKAEFRSRDRQRDWLAWRARQLAQFHRDMLEDLTRRRPDTRLLLLGGNAFTSPAVQPLLRPTLPNEPDVQGALLQLGLDVEQYADQDRIVFCRPDRIAPRTPLNPQAVNINLATNPVVDSTFLQLQSAASLFYHEVLPISLPSFDAASPFGQDNTRTALFTHVAPSGVHNRQRFVHHLALRDVQTLLDGGWMLSLGQEEALQSLFDTLRCLPARGFETIEPLASGLPSQPLVVRTLAHDKSTYVYVVNDSPWPISAEIDAQTPGPCPLAPLGSRSLPEPRWTGTQMTWDIDLEPYDVVAAVIHSDQVRVETWRVTIDRNSYAQLRQQVNELSVRATMLARASSLDVLANPGFEQAADRLPGWIHAQGSGISITPTSQEHFDGAQSLRMATTEQEKVAWIRSDPFSPPKTGRIAVMVRLKVADPQQQPPLRLAIEGRRFDGSTYYKPFNVAQNARVQLLDTDWGEKPFVMLVSDLPTQELADLRVGFDLMGPGEVWIDDVQVYDRWFPKNERDDLMIMSGLAARSLSMGQLADCQRILSGYWPQFLREHVPLGESQIAALPAETPRDSHAFPPPQTKSEDAAAKASVLDKVKQHLPTKVFPFRR